MKRKIAFILFIIFMIFIIGCSNKTSFEKGDLKFTVSLVEGAYEIKNDPTGGTRLGGYVNLKICNKGEKEIIMDIPADVGGIFIEYEPEDIKNAIQVTKIVAVEPEEAPIILPDQCPTYKYTFSEGWEEAITPMKAFRNAKYFFVIGENKFPLKGTDNTRTEMEAKQEVQDSLKAVGLTEEQARAILNKISQEAPLDECPEGLYEIPCLYSAWEYTFKKNIPQGKEVICELIKKEDIKPLCKSGVTKSLSEVEENFNKYIAR